MRQDPFDCQRLSVGCFVISYNIQTFTSFLRRKSINASIYARLINMRCWDIVSSDTCWKKITGIEASKPFWTKDFCEVDGAALLGSRALKTDRGPRRRPPPWVSSSDKIVATCPVPRRCGPVGATACVGVEREGPWGSCPAPRTSWSSCSGGGTTPGYLSAAFRMPVGGDPAGALTGRRWRRSLVGTRAARAR